MPASDVTVNATFVSENGEAPQSHPFTDVPSGSWYEEAVQYVYENGLMSGVSEDAFGPDLTTSRAMVVTILYRLAGSPETGSADFADVPADQYYAAPVAWASSCGVVSGYSADTFGPNDPITREQMALILYRFAQEQKQDTSKRGDLTVFADADQISSYAVDALSWANAQGLINGVDAVTLSPAGRATRAQAATILTQFCRQMAD